MMFVLPMMMFKGLHWGYTRFYLNRFCKPKDYTEDDKIRRFHPDDAILNPVAKATATDKQKTETKESKCPVSPALRVFGLQNKKPPGHPSSDGKTTQEILAEVKG